MGISYWTASLPIAAETTEWLQRNAGPDTGAGSLTSVDGDDIILGKPLIGQLKVSSLIPGRSWKKRDEDNGDRRSVTLSMDNMLDSILIPSYTRRICTTHPLASIWQLAKELQRWHLAELSCRSGIKEWISL